MDAEDYHFRFKFCFIGDNGVGKSALLDALTQKFGKVLETEAVEEMHFKSVVFVDETTYYRIHYWDLPGSDRYLPLTSRYAAGATAAIFVFDISKRSSFDRMELWLQECQKVEILTKLLIGNHPERSRDAVVTHPEANALASKYGMEYFDLNPFDENSLARIFEHIFNSIVANIPNPPDPGMLLGKGISLGRRLINDPKFRTALFDTDSKYD
mmetsp:Transcript_28926/g.51670  ORF Transcript_28926/g.51670 Transcript_28926/m.51670 type:complete len:212 (+) Transcript_28926:364-999(+)